MVRYYFGDVPISRLAVWSRRLALFALVITILSVMIVRTGFLEIVPALATFAAALIFAALAVLLALAAFVAIWQLGLGGLRFALAGLFIGLLLLAYPGYFGYYAYKLPRISDITTDPVDPPKFAVTARLRPRGTNAYPGAETARIQNQDYPDVEPLEVDIPPKTAHELAYAIARRRKWHVVDSRPPIAGRRAGVIEAVARTFVMGFRDDIVIRVSAAGKGSRIDMRSASRYGRHDLGTNAARVQSFLTEFDETVATLPPAPIKPEPAKKPQPRGRQPARQ